VLFALWCGFVVREGDRLVFEVDHVQKQPIVEVYINGCYCDVAKSIDLV